MERRDDLTLNERVYVTLTYSRHLHIENESCVIIVQRKRERL